MKNRRRLLAALLAACVFAAAGCSNAKEPGEEPEELQPEEAQEETESEDAAADQAETCPEVLQIRMVPDTYDNYDPDSGKWLVHTEYCTVQAVGEGAGGAAEAIQKWSDQRIEELKSLADRYAPEAAEVAGMREPSEGDDYYEYSIFQNVETARVDARVISLVELSSEYTGGAHGSYGSSGINFDAGSGEILELSDILSDEAAFQEKAEAEIVKKVSEQYGEGLFPEYKDTIHQMWENSPNWYLDAAGITFIFTPYEIAPYAAGEIFVTVPYTDVAETMKESFMPERFLMPSGAGTAKIPAGETVSLFLSAADSQAEQLKVYLDDQGESYGPVCVELNNFRIETESFERIGDAGLICRADGRVFVIFDADYASDDFVTFVYEITDGTLEERDCRPGLSLQDGSVNTQSIRLRMHLDVLGSYNSLVDYTIGSDGRLETSAEWFEISQTGNPWQLLTTTRELPVVLEEGESTLPAGSRIRITATDNAGKARFTEEGTGRSGEIHYVRGDGAEDEWTIFIDGIPDYEYFEQVPYAG